MVVNSGTIATRFEAVRFTGAGGTIDNSGLIATTSAGSGDSAIVITSTGVDSHISNSGTIRSGGSAGTIGIASSSTGTLTVLNTGRIEAGSGAAISTVSGALDLTNSGIIQGTTAIQAGTFSDVIVNHGLIQGNVQLGNGVNVFDTIGGTFTGIVFGDGSDTYRIDKNILIVDTLGVDRIEAAFDITLASYTGIENLTLLAGATRGTGNALVNSMDGNEADNVLSGVAGNDALFGNGGNDTLDGGLDNDSLNGGLGDDRLLGRGGLDTINGEDGEDWIQGGGSADTLFGGDGDDTIIGGGGRDRMFGDADADTFIYLSHADSGIATNTRDIISAFEPGIDRIDLSAVDANANLAGNDAFIFIGGGAFTNVAGQLRYGLVSGIYLLEADRDGNGVADFQVQITGPTVLANGDVIL